MSDQCKSCRFWLPVPDPRGDNPSDGAGWGWCRRDPPRVSDHMATLSIPTVGLGRGASTPEEAATVGNVADATLFPATYRTVWCGRFEPAFHPNVDAGCHHSDAMVRIGREALQSARADLRSDIAL